MSDEIKRAAKQADRLAAEAAEEADVLRYTHRFSEPVSYGGHTVQQLTFDWSLLTGKDHLAIEDELLLAGKTLVVPAFTGAFLTGMAVRACTDRDSNGLRIVDADFLEKLPIRDYQTICMSARRFLLRSESAPETAEAGSEHNA